MRTPIFTTFSLLTLAAAKAIQDATETQLNAALLENDLVLAAFTSHALEPLRPSTESIRQVAENSSTPFLLIDCDQEATLCKEQDINAYPTIRLLTRNDENKPEIIRYRGRRTKPAIRSLVTKYELPVLSHVESEDLEHFKKIDDIVVVAYLQPDQDALLEAFHGVAEKHYGGYVFGYSTTSSGADMEASSGPSIVVYKNNDGDVAAMTGHFSEADVESFLEAAGRTVIREFKEKEIEDFMVYEKFVTFAVADIGEYAPMATNFGLDANSAFPAMVVHAPMNDNVFLYRQGNDIIANVVEDMLMSILQGKASSGQVFGDGAPSVHDTTEGGVHTEL